MGFMAENEAPGSVKLVMGEDLRHYIGGQVAFMGIVEAVDDQQNMLRLMPVGGNQEVNATLAYALEFGVRAGQPLLIFGQLNNLNSMVDAKIGSPADLQDDPAPFNDDLFRKTVNKISRFGSFYSTAPPS